MVADAGVDKPTGASQFLDACCSYCESSPAPKCFRWSLPKVSHAKWVYADMGLDLRSPLGIVPAALHSATAPATRGAQTAPKPMATPELQRSEGRRKSVDSVGSPSKHAISRPSPQFLSYRRYCRERNLGLRTDSSARLKVHRVLAPKAFGTWNAREDESMAVNDTD